MSAWPSLILASGSPRRAELLRAAGYEFSIAPADVDETPAAGELPVAYVERVARDKCAAGIDAAPPDAVVIAADTTVDLDGGILAKPSDPDEAALMLRSLSGRSHRVHTAVVVGGGGRCVQTTVTTLVVFGELTDAEIDWYVGTGDPFDKAGGYGLQSAGAVLVERIEGSHSNVIGLPLRETADLLRSMGHRLG